MTDSIASPAELHVCFTQARYVLADMRIHRMRCLAVARSCVRSGLLQLPLTGLCKCAHASCMWRLRARRVETQ
eukprot:6906127-Prorocentrum_lima.AAC.1